MFATAIPTPRRALLVCIGVAAIIAMCAGLVSAAVLAPAPVAALPLIVAIGLGLPMLAALELSTSIAVLRHGREHGLRRRHLADLRRQLDRLPETAHPLDG